MQRTLRGQVVRAESNSRGQQRCCLIEAAEQIEVLHGDAGGTFQKVIETRDDNELLATEANR